MAVATFDDVATALGRSITSDAEIMRVDWWLNAAELLIVSRLGPVEDLDQAAVAYVEAEAVAARLSNPGGFQSETVDDYTYRLPDNTRQVSILDEWWDLLTPNSTTAAFSIRSYGEPDVREDDTWVTPTELL